MKEKIHQKWYPKAKVSCACGSTFESGSTEPEIRVEICGACHPFFTGQQKFVDTEGRVDRFEKRRKTALKAGEQVKQKKAKKEAEKTREKTRPKTLKEVLEKNSKQS